MYAPNLESLLIQQYVCVMCTLWSDNTYVFTRFHSVKYAAYLELWSLISILSSQLETSLISILLSQLDRSLISILSSQLDRSLISILSSQLDKSLISILSSPIDKSSISILSSQLDKSSISILSSQLDRSLISILSLICFARNWFVMGSCKEKFILTKQFNDRTVDPV